jgi:hypothetical protein
MQSQLGESLDITLSRSDLPNALGNLSEVAIDSLLSNGVLKDIPVIGTLLAIGKTVGTVKDYLFAKRLILFLTTMSSLSTEERNALVLKLENDETFRAKAGETIVELISRIDGDIKPKCAAVALKHYASGKINATDLIRLNHAIERFLFCDYEKLDMFCDSLDPFVGQDDPAAANFINAGLGYTASGYGAGGVQATSLCSKFRDIAREAKL